MASGEIVPVSGRREVVDAFVDRVERAAMEVGVSPPALSPRAAVRAERENMRRDRIADADRVRSLRQIIAGFRVAVSEAGDIGTQRYFKARRVGAARRTIRRLFQIHPRGWPVADLPAEIVLPGAYSGALRRCRLELVLLTDSRLYAAVDGAIWDRYRLGQREHPELGASFPMQAWRDLEDTVPEHIGRLVGQYQLRWSII